MHVNNNDFSVCWLDILCRKIHWMKMNDIFQAGNSCYRHQTSTNADQNLYSDIQIRKSTEKMNTRVCTLCWEYLTNTLP